MSAQIDREASARRFVARLAALGVSDGRVLDLRCGAGATCLLLGQRGGREILGVDPRDVSAAQAALAQAEPDLRRRVRFEQVNPDAWEPERGRYDLVLLRGGWHGYVEAERRLTQARAALAPAGSVVIEFSPQRRGAAGTERERMSLESFADLMARSRLHCTWYRAEIGHGRPGSGGSVLRDLVRVVLVLPIPSAHLPTTVLSAWRHPLYD